MRAHVFHLSQTYLEGLLVHYKDSLIVYFCSVAKLELLNLTYLLRISVTVYFYDRKNPYGMEFLQHC